MKKQIALFSVLALLVSMTFVGCKVGADDPGLTFSSRDGRLIRVWNLTGFDAESVDSSGLGVLTTVVSYNGNIRTETSRLGSTTLGTSSESYTLMLTFDKGGRLTALETVDGDITEESDYWEWLGNDKNRADLILGSSSDAAGIWSVLRLTSKELVLERSTSQRETNNGSQSLSTDNVKLTFAAE